MSIEAESSASLSAQNDDVITVGSDEERRPLLKAFQSESVVEPEPSEQTSCCSYTTKKYLSLAYVACVFICSVIFVVAAQVKTDEKAYIRVGTRSVHRYLAVVLFVSLVWMLSFIVFSSKYGQRWFANWNCLKSHVEPEKQLVPTRLLIGVMFFGLGNSFMTMVEFLEYVAEYNCPDKDLSMLLYFIVRTLFIYMQLYFLYKLSSRSKKTLIFGHVLFMHLIAVNLGTWIVTFVYDSAEELKEEGNHRNSSMSDQDATIPGWVSVDHHAENLKDCEKNAAALKSIAKTLEPYLYTFTMEYCLLSAGLLLNAWLSLHQGEVDHNAGRKLQYSRTWSSYSTPVRRFRECNSQRADTEEESPQSDGIWEKIEVPEVLPEVGTLWRFGFIFGLAFIPVFTGMVFNVLFSDNVERDRLIYIGMQCSFFVCVLAASVNGIRNVNMLQEVAERDAHGTVDFILLAVSLVGVIFLDFFVILASICEASHHPVTASFLLVTNLMEPLASIAFAVFVRKSLQQKLVVKKENEVFRKSAATIREIVSFLFVLNICFWGLYTFEVKKSGKVLEIVEVFYTWKVWFYLSHTVYPLAVFFHFHGAVCMLEILSNYSIVKTETVKRHSPATPVIQGGQNNVQT